MKRFWFYTALVLFLALFQWGISPYINAYWLQIINMIGINAILAVSLNFIMGHAGQFSLGHAGFMALGAYTSAAITVYGSYWGLPPVILFLGALVIGGILAAIISLIVGIPTLRLKGDYLAIATLGLGEIIRVIILNLDFVGGARGFTNIPEQANFFWIYLFLGLAVIVFSRIISSSKGRAFLAVRDDEVAAVSVGINPTYYKVMAFAIGAFWAGLAGGLFAHLNTYLNTNSFGFIRSIEIVTMVVLGGLGSISGSLIAAFILTLLPEFLRVASEARMVVYALLLIGMMILRPNGLMGRKEMGWIKKL
jgi:branched-chain amino acid transport system permease protein